MLTTIPLDQLDPHPLNSNRMSPGLFRKLREHLARNDRYPPIIARPVAADRYQILDGHHRARALRELNRTTAQCIIWHVDEREAALLLATLNTLRGRDNPRARATLLDQLRQQHGNTLTDLAAMLPESASALRARLRALNPAPAPKPQTITDDLPRAAHFFLKPADLALLNATLRQLNQPRDQALMHMVHLTRKHLSHKLETSPPTPHSACH